MSTIVVTSANCATAGLLIPRLREMGYRVVGLVRREAKIVVDEMIVDWTEAMAAREALAKADIIIHLSGDANAKNAAAYRNANYETTKIVSESAVGIKRQRIIYLSYANAKAGEKNLYLHYKGRAEMLLLGTGKEVVIFRCPVIIDGPGQASRIDDLFLSKNGRVVPVLGNGQQKMHPVYRGDVVKMIVAALEKGSGVYELSGPEEFSVDDFVRLANGDARVRMRHIPAWIVPVLSRVVPGLSPTFADLMLHHTNSIYDPGTYREFGVEATRMSALYGVVREP